MIPYLHTPWGNISTFSIAVVIGVLSMLIVLHILLANSNNRNSEETFIFPKIVICGMGAFLFAGLFDSLSKVREYDKFEIAGISFYGGLIGAIIFLYALLKFSKQKTQYSIREWYNLLTLPLISFHFWGRIGCFLGGCCYGKNSNNFLGILFPDNIEHGIFHNGLKCYPTQLFEALALVIIFTIILFIQNKFEIYLLLYSIFRFIIEIFRGDNRGYVVDFLSPAQLISIVIFLLITVRIAYKKLNKPKSKTTF